MAKLGAVIDGWMKETDCTISAIQCWTSLEEYFGVVPCTIMSMMSENLFSSACEVDIVGVVSMYALALASETPSALLDWNNNYGDDPDKAVCFHCSNLPKHFFDDVSDGLSGDHRRHGGQGEHLRHLRGPREGRRHELRRFSTDDYTGKIRGYVGEGEFTNDPLETFGGAGVVQIPKLQKLLRMHLRKRLRAPRSRELLDRGQPGLRSGHPLPGLGHALSRAAGVLKRVQQRHSLHLNPPPSGRCGLQPARKGSKEDAAEPLRERLSY